jgi:hypothetical protein
MSSRLYKDGTVEFAIDASDKLAIYSVDGVKVYVKPLNTSTPGAWALLKELTPDTDYTSAAFTTAKEVKLEAKYGEVLYAVGTDPVISERKGLRLQEAPGVLNSTGTLTAAMIGSGIVTSTTAAAVTATVPTGAVMDGALDMDIGESIDWSVIVTGSTNALTVTAAATGHTIVGAGAVVKSSSGLFRTRKTAAATFITYRIG